jgi:hypothetical protein
MTDNAGATSEHRAINYLAMRFSSRSSLTSGSQRPSHDSYELVAWWTLRNLESLVYLPIRLCRGVCGPSPRG